MLLISQATIKPAWDDLGIWFKEKALSVERALNLDCSSWTTP